MKIDWQLYEEDEIDPEDPIGTMVLGDGDGHEIRQEATYLDSWFQALIDGLGALQASDEAHVEMQEEPDPLEFRLADGRVALKFDAVTVDGGPLADLEESVHRELIRFLDVMRQLEGWEANPTLLQLAESIEI
jgi:hypothetical protein